jgi:hypothetical protein
MPDCPTIANSVRLIGERDEVDVAVIRRCYASAGVGLFVVGIAALWLANSAVKLTPSHLIAWSCTAGVCVAPLAASALRNWRAWLLEPLVTLYLGFIVYQVIGTLVIVHYYEHDAMNRFFHGTLVDVDPRGMLRACGGVSVGMALSTVGYCLTPRSHILKWAVPGLRPIARVSIRVCAVGFLAVGSLAQIVDLLASHVPTVFAFGQIVPKAVALGLAGVVLALWSRPRVRFGTVALVAVALAAIQAGIGLLALSKQAIAKPVMAVLLGEGLRKRGLMRGAVLAALPVLVVAAVASTVSVARELASSGSSSVEALKAAGGETQEVERVVWLRLSYAGTQAAVMAIYDSGIRGRDFQLIPWLVVPRLIAPSKPEITRGGQEYYEHLTGRTGSSDCPGLFVDGYFQAGWLGLGLSSLVTGLVLGLFAALAQMVMQRELWLLFPLVLMGHFVGVRFDGHFVPDVLGSAVFLLGGVSSLVLLGAFGRSLRPRGFLRTNPGCAEESQGSHWPNDGSKSSSKR